MSNTLKLCDSASEARRQLFARQESLLRYLTRPASYESRPEQSVEQETSGIDAQRLRLVGRLSLTKRLNKVEALLPATLHCILHHAPDLISEFANQCPPINARRYANAQQFHDFLSSV